MLGLSKRTELNNGSGKRIPKEKFYSKLDLSGSQERLFIDQIQSIRWTNKISPESMNLSLSGGIQEIEVFEIVLKGDLVDERLLKIIDRAIIHPILFIIRNDSKDCLCMAFKEMDDASNVSVKQYYSTRWGSKDGIVVDFSGLSTGELYKNIIIQISEGRLNDQDKDSDLSDLVTDYVEYQKVLKKIQKLEDDVRKTSQPNKKLELVHELRDLKSKWGVE